MPNTNSTNAPTISQTLASYGDGAYRKYGDDRAILDWTGSPIVVGAHVEWRDANGGIVSGEVRVITDRPGALWDGSTDAALTITVTPNHTAICSARSVVCV